MPAATEVLDDVFHALAHPTRRKVVQRLGRGPAAVCELAKPFDIALPSFMQHLRLLEDCGLVRSKKVGRVRTVQLVPTRLRRATDWLIAQREVWEQRLDQLDSYLTTLEENPDA